MKTLILIFTTLATLLSLSSSICNAFTSVAVGIDSTVSHHRTIIPTTINAKTTTIRSSLHMTAAAGGGAAEEKSAVSVTGEQLELMLQEFDQPLVVDAYATWCGPCLLMAPEFEEAAKELKGKVRFAKLDTDKEENMAARLNIMGLPTLLFLDKYEATTPEEASDDARAVLKGRIEGALRKQNIKDLCDFYFFNGPEPKLF